MHRLRLTSAAAVLAIAGLVMPAAAATGSVQAHAGRATGAADGHDPSSAAHHNRRNIAPSPDFFGVCADKGRDNPDCIRTELAAIRNARSHEHMKRRTMTLPDNYRSLSVAEQTFVVTDLERVDRGRPPIAGLTKKLDGLSRLAASLQRDPIITLLLAKVLGITDYRSIWANDLGPLASDYDWMYEDGYGGINGINRACLRPHQWGCWGHRANILISFPKGLALSAGAGTAHPLGASIAEIVACGRSHPAYLYTWAEALAHGANGHRVTAH